MNCLLLDYEKFYETESSMDEVFISRLLRGEKWCPFEILSVGFIIEIRKLNASAEEKVIAEGKTSEAY